MGWMDSHYLLPDRNIHYLLLQDYREWRLRTTHVIIISGQHATAGTVVNPCVRILDQAHVTVDAYVTKFKCHREMSEPQRTAQQIDIIRRIKNNPVRNAFLPRQLLLCTFNRQMSYHDQYSTIHDARDGIWRIVASTKRKNYNVDCKNDVFLLPSHVQYTDSAMTAQVFNPIFNI